MFQAGLNLGMLKIALNINGHKKVEFNLIFGSFHMLAVYILSSIVYLTLLVCAASPGIILLLISVSSDINSFTDQEEGGTATLIIPLLFIIIPVLLILLIAWSVLWIPAKQIESRLTTSIVALLALIAYNFVFQDEIPKLDMLTSLDQFILLSYLFCSIPIFMTIFLSRFVTTNQKRAYLFNRRMRLWGGIIYVLTNCQIFFL